MNLIAKPTTWIQDANLDHWCYRSSICSIQPNHFYALFLGNKIIKTDHNPGSNYWLKKLRVKAHKIQRMCWGVYGKLFL